MPRVRDARLIKALSAQGSGEIIATDSPTLPTLKNVCEKITFSIYRLILYEKLFLCVQSDVFPSLYLLGCIFYNLFYIKTLKIFQRNRFFFKC